MPDESTQSPIPKDHDQRFKTLIKLFMPEFVKLFFPATAAKLDFSDVNWLDKEVQPDPPEGKVHELDLVAKLRSLEPVDPARGLGRECLLLLNIEIESPDRTTLIKKRWPGYYIHLSGQYGLPVLPIVLYLDVALQGLGIDRIIHRVYDIKVLEMEFPYVGLPGLDGESYIHGESLLGVALAALMKIPEERAVELAKIALQRLREGELNDAEYFLLNECFEAYAPLTAPEWVSVKNEITPRATGEKIMRPRNKTSFDLGWEEGEASGEVKGEVKGERKAALEMLEIALQKRFGPLSGEIKAALAQFPKERLMDIFQQSFTAQSLDELGIQPVVALS
jgi:hypothetical protein